MGGEYTLIFSRRLTKKFLALYKELPCLWNRRNLDYKQRQKRHDAITKLTELVKEHDPNATRVHVMRKIESLRACARREHNKVRKSRIKAKTGGGDIHVPQLWYYDLISFLFADHKTPTVKSYESDSESDEEEPQVEDEVFIEPADTYQEYNTATCEIEVPRYNGAFEEEHSVSKRHEVHDEYDAIGINVAAKLRGLPQNTRIIAEKLINDVLFQAQTNGLNSTTTVTTTDPFKQSIM